jgi:hypothetical protein
MLLNERRKIYVMKTLTLAPKEGPIIVSERTRKNKISRQAQE